MPTLKRKQIHQTASSMGNNEDWWTLIFDSESNSIYVEHEWSYTPLGGGSTDSGKENFSIEEFLNQGGNRSEHRQLIEMIESMFQEGS